jgi:hypothetical protein
MLLNIKPYNSIAVNVHYDQSFKCSFTHILPTFSLKLQFKGIQTFRYIPSYMVQNKFFSSNSDHPTHPVFLKLTHCFSFFFHQKYIYSHLITVQGKKFCSFFEIYSKRPTNRMIAPA